MAYTLISSTYFTVAISGYWAFGQTCLPYLLNNLSNPTWPITIANIAAIVQITGCYQVSLKSLVWYIYSNSMAACFAALASRSCVADLEAQVGYLLVVCIILYAVTSDTPGTGHDHYVFIPADLLPSNL